MKNKIYHKNKQYKKFTKYVKEKCLVTTNTVRYNTLYTILNFETSKRERTV